MCPVFNGTIIYFGNRATAQSVWHPHQPGVRLGTFKKMLHLRISNKSSVLLFLDVCQAFTRSSGGNMHDKNDSENRDSLLKIQEAEKKAEKMVNDANSKRERILEQARLDSIEAAKQIESEAEKARADLLVKTRKKIETEKSSLTAKNDEEIKKLKSKADSKIEAEAKEIVSKFTDEILK